MCVGTLDFDVNLVRKLGFTELGYPEVKAKSFDFKRAFKILRYFAVSSIQRNLANSSP